jgi:quercetin dioxygenase-like cupin family protein
MVAGSSHERYLTQINQGRHVSASPNPPALSPELRPELPPKLPPELPPELQKRLVRYSELRPCINAFIDARSPGSDKKENFTIIGPGVAENPNQYVHIREPHGFNIGGARQPPQCTNSLHSHDTAEVFIIHQGMWRFFWGERGDAGEVVLQPGDTISIPIHIFRGFENVGRDIGFMFAVLGGDDPGRVHWAPHVIEKARSFGLILLEDGSLIDTIEGAIVPEDAAVVTPSSRAEIAYIREPTLAEMTSNVVTHESLIANTQTGAKPAIKDSAIIGSGQVANGISTAPISTPHGFALHHLALDAGTKTSAHTRACAEVLMVHRGCVVWRNQLDESIELHAGDTFTVPRNMPRQIEAISDAEIFIVFGDDNTALAQRQAS